MRPDRQRRVGAWSGMLALLATVPFATAAANSSASLQEDEAGFSTQIEEPVIRYEDPPGSGNWVAVETDDDCIEDQNGDGRMECKPTAGSLAVTAARDQIMYFNALEATEDVENSIVAEYGSVSINDQVRRLDLSGDAPAWSLTTPVRADLGDEDDESNPLVDELSNASESGHNDNALFCTDLTHRPDGRVMVVGGTDYYNDPGVPGTGLGVVELEGARSTRFYDPASGEWEAGPKMNHGRWYPSMVTLGSGDTFVASGVKKLLKPFYPDGDPEDNNRNVPQTETYDASENAWVDNGESGEKSLPLYPRLHLLPNGDVYYDAAGQVYNPQGQAYDEALWNMASAYDPEDNAWIDLGVPGLTDGSSTQPGFRGSTFSIMLPLAPAEDGSYGIAEFLTAGGVVGVTPGSYLATDHSRITTVDASGDDPVLAGTRDTGSFNNRRWYSTGVVLPDGSVMAFSGADRDEVVGPGTGTPVLDAERFDPETETWEVVDTSDIPRTYHNTAALLRDGRVMVSGHAPISTLYGSNTTLADGVTSPNQGREPITQIFTPEYVLSDQRPVILDGDTDIEDGQQQFTFTLGSDDGEFPDLEAVTLIRNTAITHLVDGDQRAVELDFAQNGAAVTAALPAQDAVLPPGPYFLFASAEDGDGNLIPSEGLQITIR